MTGLFRILCVLLCESMSVVAGTMDCKMSRCSAQCVVLIDELDRTEHRRLRPFSSVTALYPKPVAVRKGKSRTLHWRPPHHLIRWSVLCRSVRKLVELMQV